MKKIKLDFYDLGIIINALYSFRQTCDLEAGEQIDSILLWLIEIHERMNPSRNIKIEFKHNQIRLVVLCLNEWRNSFLSESKINQAEAISETMTKLKD